MPATVSRTTQSCGVNRRGTPPPEQAEATIATRAKKHCRNPNGALIAHIVPSWVESPRTLGFRGNSTAKLSRRPLKDWVDRPPIFAREPTAN